MGKRNKRGGFSAAEVAAATKARDTVDKRRGTGSMLLAGAGAASASFTLPARPIAPPVRLTAEVKVPVEDLLGEENRGFSYLGQNLPRERLSIAVGAYSQAKAAVQLASEYTKQRTVFGQPVAGFQNTKFELAACQADVDAAEAVVDRAMDADDLGELTPADAAKAKLFCTEVAARVIDRCLQLHGGYGYINEYPIARLYADNRVTRIYGGTSEVMKMIIAKDMGL